jgi:hypothetical protein
VRTLSNRSDWVSRVRAEDAPAASESRIQCARPQLRRKRLCAAVALRIAREKRPIRARYGRNDFSHAGSAARTQADAAACLHEMRAACRNVPMPHARTRPGRGHPHVLLLAQKMRSRRAPCLFYLEVIQQRFGEGEIEEAAGLHRVGRACGLNVAPRTATPRRLSRCPRRAVRELAGVEAGLSLRPRLPRPPDLRRPAVCTGPDDSRSARGSRARSWPSRPSPGPPNRRGSRAPCSPKLGSG